MPFELYYVRRAFTVMLVVLGLLAVGLTWAQVVRKIADATPPASPVAATSVVWGDLVFQKPRHLNAWLRVHGVAYSVWSGRHPFASSALEHRSLHIARQGPPPHRASAKAAAASKSKTAAASKSKPAGRGSEGFPTKTVVVALLALLAALAALAASTPGALRYRYPEVARGIADHRDLLLAGAAAVMIGIITGVFLN